MASGVRIFPWASTTDLTASVTKLSARARCQDIAWGRMKSMRPSCTAAVTCYGSTCIQQSTIKIEHDAFDAAH